MVSSVAASLLGFVISYSGVGLGREIEISEIYCFAVHVLKRT